MIIKAGKLCVPALPDGSASTEDAFSRPRRELRMWLNILQVEPTVKYRYERWHMHPSSSGGTMAVRHWERFDVMQLPTTYQADPGMCSLILTPPLLPSDPSRQMVSAMWFSFGLTPSLRRSDRITSKVDRSTS